MRYSRKEMKIRVDYNNMMSAVLGRAHGITATELETVAERADRAFDAWVAKAGLGRKG